MPAEVVKSKKVKTRKEHKCFGCNYTIPKGFDVERQVIRNGRELYTIHLCNSCQKLIEENLNPGEEYEEGYFEDFYKNVRKAHTFRCGMDSTKIKK